jgi:hypothetical protein
MHRRILKLLTRSMDVELAAPDLARLEAALKESEDLRRTRDELLAVRRAAADSAASGFSPGFADKVLAGTRLAVRRPQKADAVFDSFKTVFKPLAVASAILLVLLVTYSVTHGDLIPRGEIYYASDITLNKILQLSSF